jgi:hypothetical protein
VGPLDADGIEHGHPVGPHVGQAVRRRGVLAGADGVADGPEARGGTGRLRGEADVTVVVAEDAVAGIHQELAEVVSPVDELPGEPAHQQHGGVVLRADGLVVDLVLVVGRRRHGGDLTGRV